MNNISLYVFNYLPKKIRILVYGESIRVWTNSGFILNVAIASLGVNNLGMLQVGISPEEGSSSLNVG
jgi:hypothetical protein